MITFSGLIVFFLTWLMCWTAADPIRSMDQVNAMKKLDDPGSSLPFIQETLSSLRQEIDDSATLLGFVGSPWTLTAYSVEGAAERHCKATKVCNHDPSRWEQHVISHISFALPHRLMYL